MLSKTGSISYVFKRKSICFSSPFARFISGVLVLKATRGLCSIPFTYFDGRLSWRSNSIPFFVIKPVKEEKEIKIRSTYLPLRSFYRPLNAKIDFLENLQSSMSNINEYNKEKPIFLAGDFNLLHINWKNNALKNGGQSAHSQKLLEIAKEFAMDQMQTKPTREENNFDLFFIKYPSLVKSCNVIPGISDHDMVVSDIELKPQYNKPKRRETFRFKNAKWSDIKSFISSKGEEIIQNKHSVEEKWQELKKCINKTLNLNVPKKMTSKDTIWLG